MYVRPTEAHTHDCCESECNYRAFESSGELKAAVESYGIGMRSTSILQTLAYARVWGKNIGVQTWPPNNMAQTEWNEILDGLVREHLGEYRCLDCGKFHNANTIHCVPDNTCPNCCGVSEGTVD